LYSLLFLWIETEESWIGARNDKLHVVNIKEKGNSKSSG
jgi:hypothetical protein